MGYTHYWKFKTPPRGQTALYESRYQRAIKECQRVIKAWQRTASDTERLSGYSAHVKLGQYGGIKFNGKKENAHEDFVLREYLKQNESFNFCKTAQKPYDTVVVACLAVLKYRLGEMIEVSSDGYADDWIDGVKLASSVLDRKITNPITREFNKHEELFV